MIKTTAPNRAGRALRLAAPALLVLGLSGCISLGGPPPESLLTLSATTPAPTGSGAMASAERPVIAVLGLDTPAKLDVLRVPVAVSDTEIAYLKEAFWVEKPARLFRHLLGETLRAKSGDKALVLDGDETVALATISLRGTLVDMGYDARSSSVVVRFDAIRVDSKGNATTRRFEARESGVPAEARAVSAALNRAANTVAGGLQPFKNAPTAQRHRRAGNRPRAARGAPRLPSPGPTARPAIPLRGTPPATARAVLPRPLHRARPAR
jgi:cholesterol transport system auxiliary component